ncbi:MAG: DUF2283 domain-containing protein [Chloroflexota bacterium]|nr:DUF2283 domain-containing protein [Chloroflexota bacterium]
MAKRTDDMTASVTLNEVGDILYVRLRNGDVAKTQAYGDDRLVDFDANGLVLGAEFIGVEGKLDLRGLPDSERIRETLTSLMPPQIAEHCELAAD